MDFLSSSTAHVVGMENDFSTRCVNCAVGYSDATVEQLCMLFNMGRRFSCRKCAHEYTDISQFVVWVRADAAKFFNVETVRKTSWFHATDNPIWYETIIQGGSHHRNTSGANGNILVHLGTRESALLRAEQRQDEYYAHYGITLNNWFLYEVSLNANINISPSIMDDKNIFPENTEADVTEGWAIDGITRYINAYEKPGSISLLANPESFVVKQVEML